MSEPANSLIASLVYARRPTLNFAIAVSDMDAALREVGSNSYHLRWDQDDLVMFDIDGARVVLGLGDTRAAPSGRISAMVATLVIAIGPGPKSSHANKLSKHAAPLLSAIVERFHASHPPEFTLWSELPNVFSADDFEMALEEASEALTVGRVNRSSATRPPTVLDANSRFGVPEVERLMQRLVKHVAPRPVSLVPPMPAAKSRKVAAPVAIEGQQAAPAELPRNPDFANDAPSLPHPMTHEMRNIRSALYPDQPVNRGKSKAPLPQRLTIYTMNTTLMLVALPVGSAILVYNMIRGEDLNMNARAIAATGTLVGLAQLLNLPGFLNT